MPWGRVRGTAYRGLQVDALGTARTPLCQVRRAECAQARHVHEHRPEAPHRCLASRRCAVAYAQRRVCGAPVLGGGSELVRVDVTAGVATMTLSDNKKRNALSTAMMSALRTVLAELEQDAAVKVGRRHGLQQRPRPQGDQPAAADCRYHRAFFQPVFEPDALGAGGSLPRLC